MTPRGAGRGLARAAILCAALAGTARAQEPEIIVLDPNAPLIQDPRTVRPAEPRPAPRPLAAPASVLPEVAPGGADPREVLADLWFRQRALAGRGGVEEAAQQIAAALDFMKRSGLRAAPEISAAFLADGRKDLEAGDYRHANDNFRLAARFDPDAPAPHDALALGLLRGDRDPAGAAAELWAGFRLLLAERADLFIRSSNLLLVLYLALTAGAALALVLLALRSLPCLAHDLKERAAGRLSDSAARLLSWAVAGLPLLAFLPLAWVVAVWGALVFAYVRRGERVVVAAALVLLAAGGPAGRAFERLFVTSADPAARALLAASSGGQTPEGERALRRLVDARPRDPMLRFLLAGFCRAAGRDDEAVILYRQVLGLDPGNARAMVNLANIHVQREEFARAQELYRRAAEADPRLVLAPYNSHLVHLEGFGLEAADEALRRARGIDDARVTALLARGNEGRAKRRPVDAEYPTAEVWKKIVTLEMPEREAARPPIWRAPATFAGGAGLLAALVLPGLGLGSRSAGTRRCRRCGRAFCRRCQVGSKHPDHCAQCMHLFILRDGVAPGVKAKKMDEVARHRRRVFFGERFLSLVLPGGGHVLGGRGLHGALLLAAWCAIWLGGLTRGRLLVAPTAIVPAIGPGTLLALLGAGLAVWLLGNLSSHEGVRE